MKQTSLYSLLLSALLLVSCAPTVSELAETDPETIVAQKEALLAKNPESVETIVAIVSAHLNMGNEFLASGNYSEAENQYNEVLKMDNNNKIAKYGQAMISGHRLYKKGNRTILWDALEQFGKAAFYDPSKGEPYYWMGRSYEKKDDGDFDLIIEAYENALKGSLTPEIKTDTEKRLVAVKSRQKTYEDFWK